MCWDWYWSSTRASQRTLTREAESQTEKKYFQRCESCNAVFDLDGDESYAGQCRLCDRQICYMCVASLWHPGSDPRIVKFDISWGDETRLYKICDDCRSGPAGVAIVERTLGEQT